MVTPTRGRVVYAGFATARHSGGVHVLTQHVSLLRAAGTEAWLWVPDHRPGWIDADVPVLAGATTPIGAEDLLVLPETPTVHGLDPAPGARVVIFNQNHFYTYAAAPGRAAGLDFPGWGRPPGMWAVSRESRDVLREVLPGLDVDLVPNHVDGDLFTPRPAERPRVSWFPRKRPREASLLRRLLEQDDRLAGVELVELLDAPRAVVADTLGGSTVFAALGHSESFGLPVAEALAAGCLVVGYDGGGGRELFEAPGAWQVPEQRPLLLRDRVVDLVQRSAGLEAVRVANREWVLSRYSAAGTAAALDAAVTKAFTRPGSAAVATHPVAWLDSLGPNFTAFA
ncbi:MAG: glycosyltransferase [Terracoccus sp.]